MNIKVLPINSLPEGVKLVDRFGEVSATVNVSVTSNADNQDVLNNALRKVVRSKFPSANAVMNVTTSSSKVAGGIGTEITGDAVYITGPYS